MSAIDHRFPIPPSDYNLWTDSAYHGLHARVWQRVRYYLSQIVAERSRPLTHPRILEIGCGTGKTTETVLRAAPAANVVAVDANPQMVDYTSARLAEYKERRPDRLVVVCEDGVDGRLVVQNKWHGIVSVLTLHNLPKERRYQFCQNVAHALIQQWRTAKGWDERGVLILGDKIFPDDTDVARNIWEEQWMPQLEHLNAIGRPDLYQFFRQHEEEDWENRMTEGELSEILADAKLEFRFSKRDVLYQVVVARKRPTAHQLN